MSNSLSRARSFFKKGDFASAENLLFVFIKNTFQLQVRKVEIRRDGYSLNSINGWVYLEEGQQLFFKFHQEETEESGVEEYYRAKILEEAGYPVDSPLYLSTEVGKQMLLYRRHPYTRLSDLCEQLEFSENDLLSHQVIEAQSELDRFVLNKYLETIHLAEKELVKKEPIHQLFHHRLTSVGNEGRVGGRAQRFYFNQTVQFPDLEVSFEELKELNWKINGLEYNSTLAQLFEKARQNLDPDRSEKIPAVVAHADAHNGNVWFVEGIKPSLILFDPAFAGSHVPALLAEVKPTFHNIFSHPFWMYAPQKADSLFDAKVSVKENWIEIEHNFKLSNLRQKFLESKQEFFWKPFLKELKVRGLLIENWEEVIRSALFCCPTLVMNLLSGQGTHTPKTSLIGFSLAIQAGAPPVNGEDPFSRFFKEIRPLSVN